MRHLSKKEIQKIAAAILAKHGALGANLTVTGKGGGVNLGKMQATLSAPEKKVDTPLGGIPSPAPGGGGTDAKK
jgi:hypothetical protein